MFEATAMITRLQFFFCPGFEAIEFTHELQPLVPLFLFCSCHDSQKIIPLYSHQLAIFLKKMTDDLLQQQQQG